MIELFNLTYRWDPKRVDPGVMTLKGHCSFPKALGLKPHDPIV